MDLRGVNLGIGVKRNGNYKEALTVTGLHVLVIQILKRTEKDNAAEENLVAGELITDVQQVGAEGSLIVLREANNARLSYHGFKSGREATQGLVGSRVGIRRILSVRNEGATGLLSCVVQKTNGGSVKNTCSRQGVLSKCKALLFVGRSSYVAVACRVLNYLLIGPVACGNHCRKFGGIVGKIGLKVLKHGNVYGNNVECTNKVDEVVGCKNVHLIFLDGKRSHVLIHVTLGVSNLGTVVGVLCKCKVVGVLLGLQVCKAACKVCADQVVYEVAVHIGILALILVGLNSVVVLGPSVVGITVGKILVADVQLRNVESFVVSLLSSDLRQRGLTGGLTCHPVLATGGKLLHVGVLGHLKGKSAALPRELRVVKKEQAAVAKTVLVCVSVCGKSAREGCAAVVALAILVGISAVRASYSFLTNVALLVVVSVNVCNALECITPLAEAIFVPVVGAGHVSRTAGVVALLVMVSIHVVGAGVSTAAATAAATRGEHTNGHDKNKQQAQDSCFHVFLLFCLKLV